MQELVLHTISFYFYLEADKQVDVTEVSTILFKGSIPANFTVIITI
jgi:hypothetical protein